ncbi:hypothetical protein [Mastigocoleus testarum]
MMKNIFVSSLLLSLVSIVTLTNNQLAQAEIILFENEEDKQQEYKIKYCHPVTHEIVNEDPAYHPNAYVDGYRQGKRSFRGGKDYKPRTAGGEFGRGFDDGYFGRDFKGQKVTVPNKVSHYTTINCI